MHRAFSTKDNKFPLKYLQQLILDEGPDGCDVVVLKQLDSRFLEAGVCRLMVLHKEGDSNGLEVFAVQRGALMFEDSVGLVALNLDPDEVSIEQAVRQAVAWLEGNHKYLQRYSK